MDEFSDTPRRPLRPPNVARHTSPLYSISPSTLHTPRRPSYNRASTDPISPPSSSGRSSPSIPFRPAIRTSSPFSRGHTRAVSTHSALAPPMIRAQSSPGFNTLAGSLLPPQRPISPRGSPSRRSRRSTDEPFPTFSQHRNSISSLTDLSIPENEEAPPPIERSNSPSIGATILHSYSGARRSESPLRVSSIYASSVSSSPLAASPSYQTTRFADTMTSSYNYSYSSYASSSMPSTPTSLRSRSPSISSLETIEDIPDAEEAAIEAHRIAQLKVDADEADLDEAALELKRRNALDALGQRGRSLMPFGSRDKRKRWSVCGAERRGDFDLETIQED